jgi:nitrate reductase gamma subunit
MYDILTGPLLWLSFGIFIVGLIVRFILYIKGLNWQMDRVTYIVNTSYGIKGALRSIFFWLIPFGTHSWRFYPGFTIIVFIFHIGLIFSPILLPAHNILIQQAWGVSFPTISESSADILTIGVLIAAIFIILRRIALPEVRILTKPYDFLMLAIAVGPFLTGFIAYHQLLNYRLWLTLHILCGEIMLVAIPFTKLSHFLLFFLSRAQVGMDYGIKRGGMKKGMAW